MGKDGPSSFIDEGEFKNYEMDLIIPGQYSSHYDYIEKFLGVDVKQFLDSSRDFVIQGKKKKRKGKWEEKHKK